MEKYSQGNEQHYILEHFKDFKGRFLDIGSYDGRTFSNVYALSQLGWEGVCVEPSPAAFIGLMSAHKGNDNIKLVNAAVSLANYGLVEFADSNGDAVSTTNAAHKEKWGRHTNFQSIYVTPITVKDLIRVFGERYDFISLDVEGTNLEILRTIPLDIIKPSMICIEHETHFREIMDYCKGYSEIFRNAENIILRRN